MLSSVSHTQHDTLTNYSLLYKECYNNNYYKMLLKQNIIQKLYIIFILKFGFELFGCPCFLEHCNHLFPSIFSF